MPEEIHDPREDGDLEETEATPTEEHGDAGSESPPGPGAPTLPPFMRGRKPRAPRRAAERFLDGRISIGQILSGTFRTYFGGFRVFTGITLVLVLPSLVLSNYGLIGYLMGWEPDPESFLARLLSMPLIVQLIDFVLTQIAVGAVVYGVFRRQKGERVGPGRCLTTALGRVIQLTVMATSVAICVALPLAPGFLLMSVAPPLSLLMVVVGLLIFCVIYTGFYIAPAAVVVDRLGPWASLGRSLGLTRGNRWRIFCVWFVLALFKVAVNLLLSRGIRHIGADLEMDTHLWVSFGVTTASAVVCTALQAVAVGLTYYHLRLKVEGADEDDLAAVFD